MMFLDFPAYLDQDSAVRCGLPTEVRSVAPRWSRILGIWAPAMSSRGDPMRPAIYRNWHKRRSPTCTTRPSCAAWDGPRRPGFDHHPKVLQGHRIRPHDAGTRRNSTERTRSMNPYSTADRQVAGDD